MVVTSPPSLAQIYAALLQTRAAHSNVGGPPLDVMARQEPGPPPAPEAKSTTATLSPQVNILA